MTEGRALTGSDNGTLYVVGGQQRSARPLRAGHGSWYHYRRARLLEVDTVTGEIKSMRTVASHRRKGVGARMLNHILGEAARRGYHRLYLETGAGEAYAGARAFYQRFGFQFCPPFVGYKEDPNSVFMVRNL